jgi:hypothetical protein
MYVSVLLLPCATFSATYYYIVRVNGTAIAVIFYLLSVSVFVTYARALQVVVAMVFKTQHAALVG